jgi:hypothetical protein
VLILNASISLTEQTSSSPQHLPISCFIPVKKFPLEIYIPFPHYSYVVVVVAASADDEESVCICVRLFCSTCETFSIAMVGCV